MRNVPNSPQQYSKCQIRGEEIEKCLDEGFEPTYNLSTFSSMYTVGPLTTLKAEFIVERSTSEKQNSNLAAYLPLTLNTFVHFYVSHY